MEAAKIQKVSAPFLLAYIFVPVVLLTLCFFIERARSPATWVGAAACFLPAFLFALLWYWLAAQLPYKLKKKKLDRELDEMGFTRSHTFSSEGRAVVVDTVKGKLALLFRWNPWKIQIVPTSRIQRAWTDDGKVLGHSSRVSFLFLVDDVKIRMNTFTSNRSWPMTSDYILTALSKADMWVKLLDRARTVCQEV